MKLHTFSQDTTICRARLITVNDANGEERVITNTCEHTHVNRFNMKKKRTIEY